jgi:hypothetical protein
VPEAIRVPGRLPLDVPPIERRDSPAERRLEEQLHRQLIQMAARLVALLRERMRRHGLESDDAGKRAAPEPSAQNPHGSPVHPVREAFVM